MAQFSMRIPDDLKHEAEDLFSDIGLSMSSAMLIFLKTAVRERRIPFELAVSDPFYSKENMAELERRVEKLRNGTAKLVEHETVSL
jgi:DNA-damage-inducible protein J